MNELPAAPAAQLNNNVAGGSSPALGSSLRKERGAIAAQACDTCRSRKQKCDEQRPKCGTCQKFNLVCNYREPQPTKKDKTLVEILDRIKSLEGKIDSLAVRGTLPTNSTSYPPLQPTIFPPSTPITISTDIHGNQYAASVSQAPDTSSTTSGGDEHYRYVSSTHQMLAWPAMQQFLAIVQPKVPDLNLSLIERDGPSITLGAHDQRTHQGLPINTSHMPPRTHGLNAKAHHSAPGIPRIISTQLDWDNMQRLSKAYFDSINLLYPILDRQSFFSETIPSLLNDGFDHGISSTIAFLVFALGEVAIESSAGHPIHVHNGRPSGIKGGSIDQPPGLALFNEARSRMGFNLTECSLENIQVFALASLYYGACNRPMDFWRMTTSASLACQALITSNPTELDSPRADLLRRVFWHCSIIETCLNLELGFPLTGLEKMESVVGLPDFSGPFSEDNYISNQGEHFASQIVLRRLLVDFHGVLHHSATASPSMGPINTHFSSAASGSTTNRTTIQQLSTQLDQWRGMLPAPLRWHEDSPGQFPNSTPQDFGYTPTSAPLSPVSVIPTTQGTIAPPPQPQLMFTTDLDAPPARYPYALDIQVALLRSRYYYAKYLILRPFVYKALHAPDAMTHDDAVGVAECLKASLKWPIAMSPTCTQKRLIPCMFFFTQNFFGILILLHLSTTVPILRSIRSTLCGERFEMDASETIGLYLDWLRDLKPIDGAARWSWEVIKVIYGLDQ